MPNKYYPYDSRLAHRALGSAAQTSTATVATVAEKAAQRTVYLTKIILEAIAIDGNDEKYTFVVELTNDAFTTIEVAAALDFGATEVRQSGAPDSVAGDELEMIWTTEKDGVKYGTWRLRCIHAGSTSSITYGAYSTIMTGPL